MALEWRTRSGAALIRVASAGRHRVARPRGPEARRAASSVCRGRVLRRLPPAPLAHCPGLANDPYASTSAYSQTSSGTRRSSLREGPRQGCFPRAARAGSVGRGALRAAPARCSVSERDSLRRWRVSSAQASTRDGSSAQRLFAWLVSRVDTGVANHTRAMAAGGPPRRRPDPSNPRSRHEPALALCRDSTAHAANGGQARWWQE